MAEMQETMEIALEALKTEARSEQADAISGQVRIINKDQIKALVEKFVNEYSTDSAKVTKISELEAELNALKEKLQSVGMEKDGLSTQLGDLNTQMATLQSEKDDVAQKLASLEAGDAFTRMQAVEAERDQLITEKEEALARLAQMQSMLEEKIKKLEEIISSNDLQQRAKDLEYELIELKESYRQAIIGLEFIDLIEDVDFAKLLDELSQLMGKITQIETSIGDAKKAPFEMVKNRATFMQAQVKADATQFPKLIETMNDNKGSISVVVDIIRMALRCNGFGKEAEITTAALSLLG